MNFLQRFLPLLSLLIAIPVYAEQAELINTSWLEVPGTLSRGEPAYVEINGMTRTGDIITSDILNSDTSYSRVEMDCKLRQFRTVRLGYFVSSSSVSFNPIDDSWIKPNTNFHRTLAAFVCSLK